MYVACGRVSEVGGCKGGEALTADVVALNVRYGAVARWKSSACSFVRQC